MDKILNELMVKKLSGELSEADQDKLNELLSNDNVATKEYNLLIKFWDQQSSETTDVQARFEAVKEKIRIYETQTGTHSGFIHVASIRRVYLRLRPVAASIIAIAAVYGMYEAYSSISPAAWGAYSQQSTTLTGHRTKLKLSDGSFVTLNAESKLEYPDVFTGSTREVRLTGEAFFDVQKDAKRPFIIHTNKINIKVLGTSFNVKSYPDEPSVETTIIRGSVEVTFSDRPADRIILKPKDKLIIGNTALKKQSTDTDTEGNIQRSNEQLSGNQIPVQYSLTALTYYRQKDSTIVETSWMDNKIVFKNEDFLTLARKLERWYGVHIHFVSKDAETFRFTGLFQKETIEEALYALKLSEKFEYRINGKSIDIL